MISKQCAAKAWEANEYKELWGKKLSNVQPKKCSCCGDVVTYRNALKRDGMFYCSADCSVAKDGELAILEEAISKRIRLRNFKLKAG